MGGGGETVGQKSDEADDGQGDEDGGVDRDVDHDECDLRQHR